MFQKLIGNWLYSRWIKHQTTILAHKLEAYDTYKLLSYGIDLDHFDKLFQDFESSPTTPKHIKAIQFYKDLWVFMPQPWYIKFYILFCQHTK